MVSLMLFCNAPYSGVQVKNNGVMLLKFHSNHVGTVGDGYPLGPLNE
jgi:hypothetical protein